GGARRVRARRGRSPPVARIRTSSRRRHVTPTSSPPPAPPPSPAETAGEAHIVCDNLVRIYKTEGVEVVALQGLDLLVGKGELIAIVGASGSGKSTLLNVLSGLDVPTAGVARVAGTDLLSMTHRDRLRYRREV